MINVVQPVKVGKYGTMASDAPFTSLKQIMMSKVVSIICSQFQVSLKFLRGSVNSSNDFIQYSQQVITKIMAQHVLAPAGFSLSISAVLNYKF